MSPENNPTRARAKVKSDQTMKCPRCDSPNTKFCYYNNYSLTQPRHFCKTCRRYWTKGGALRNVPIGGGYRKNKKVKSSFRLSGSVDSKDSGNSSNTGLGFFNTPSPAMNLGFSRVHNNASATSLYDQFGVFFPSSSPSSLPSVGVNVDTNIAASIESLSSINQDLHWKLQQQRLAMLFEGGDNTAAGHKENGISSSIVLEDHNQKLQPFPFQNMEISKPVPDQWFFGNSYGSSSVMTAGPRGDAGGSYESGGGGGFDGVQEWNDLHQYTHLP